MVKRSDRETVLDHPLRSAILDLVRREPGIPVGRVLGRLRTLPGRSSLGQGSLSYHLYRLERAGLLTSRRSGRNRRLYEAGAPFDPTALSVLQRPKARELAELVRANAWVSQRQLRDRVGWAGTRQALAYHLQRLERAGLLASQFQGRRRLYTGTSGLEVVLEATTIDPGRNSMPAPGAVPAPPIAAGATSPPGLSQSRTLSVHLMR